MDLVKPHPIPPTNVHYVFSHHTNYGIYHERITKSCGLNEGEGGGEAVLSTLVKEQLMWPLASLQRAQGARPALAFVE